jgi:hypothetical protein
MPFSEKTDIAQIQNSRQIHFAIQQKHFPGFRKKNISSAETTMYQRGGQLAKMH